MHINSSWVSLSWFSNFQRTWMPLPLPMTLMGGAFPFPLWTPIEKNPQKTRDCWGLQGREAFLRCSEPHFLWVYAILRCSVRMYFVKYCTCDVTAIVPFFFPLVPRPGHRANPLVTEVVSRRETRKKRKRNYARTWKLIKADKMIDLIFIYRAVNWFLDYRPRPRDNFKITMTKHQHTVRTNEHGLEQQG